MSHIKLLSPGASIGDPSPRNALRHVLIVVDGFPKTLGGGERIVLRLAALLPQYGFRTSILTFHVHPETTFRPEEAPCPVYLLPLSNTYGRQAALGALELRRFLQDHDVRIVQTFFESSDIWAGLVTRVFSRAKLVWSRRDMGILRGKKHTLAYRMLRRLPHAVFAVSERVAEHVRSVDRVRPSRVHVIYNGLEISIQDRPHEERTRRTVVTTIGNIRRVKGHDLLIRAAAQVRERFPDTLFTVAGDVLEEEYFQELQELVQELSLGDAFRFLGKIEDLPSHLLSSDIFVLPSRSEGFSNALIEAMAAGVPSIATDVGGNAEALAHGKSGLIVPPEDAEALATAICSVLDDPALREQLSAGARRAVQENFTAHAMMAKVVGHYENLLNN